MAEHKDGIEPITFKRLLVAIDEDDSASSHKAFEYAVTQAKSWNMSLGVVSVLEASDINVFDSLSPEVLQRKRKAVADDVVAHVNLARSFGVKDVQGFTAEGKPAVKILKDVVPDFRPDLIVCGSKTKKPNEAKRIFIGSQASYLAQNAPCAVMVIR